MKTTITTLLMILFFAIGFSQELRYEIHGKYTRGVSKEKLEVAKTMIDIRPGYPSTMIDDYTSTEISVTTNGKIMKAVGFNDTLSADQQTILQMADVGSDINVEVGYVHQNPVTLLPDIREMHFVLSVVPEVEATYPGGYQELSSYLKKSAIDKMPEGFSKENKLVVIGFTVTETGDIINARVSQSSTDPEIDRILLKAINRMPNWTPAENGEGAKVYQEFEFIVGNGGC